MKKDKIDIIFSGVGGQGILLLSELVSLYFIKCGYDVKKSEIHGMSQRGGSVYSNVRVNKDRVYSPYIDIGSADLLVSLEMLEAVRFSKYLRKNSILITSSLNIYPNTVIIGKEKYPSMEEFLSYFKKGKWQYYIVDTNDISKKVGNNRIHNIAVLGAAALYFDANNHVLSK
jgi:indolepyruvate ferredoxin oxidoreductase beta subunit